jgi:hypothetical protein
LGQWDYLLQKLVREHKIGILLRGSVYLSLLRRTIGVLALQGAFEEHEDWVHFLAVFRGCS